MHRFTNLLRWLGQYFVNPSRDQIAVGNLAFFVTCLCSGVLTGSLVSVITVGGVLFGFLQVFRGVTPWRSEKAVVATSLAFAAFFSAELLAALVSPGGDALQKIGSNLLFLGLMPLSALLIVDRERLISAIEKSAALISVVGAVLAIFAPTQTSGRIELAAGNAGVLAVLAGVLFLINVIALFRHGQPYWRYSVAGMVGAAIIIILSGMRALWPCLVLVPIMTLSCFGWRSTGHLTHRYSLLLAFGLLAFGSFMLDTIAVRIEALEQDVQLASQNNLSSSLGYRLIMWEGGAELIKDRPILGYGLGNVGAKINETFKAAGHPNVGFSHFHNVFINELIRAGLIGLLALVSMYVVPLYFVYKSPKSPFRSVALCMIIGVETVFLLSGMTGIMIGHDIMDALFLSAVSYVLYLIRPESELVPVKTPRKSAVS